MTSPQPFSRVARSAVTIGLVLVVGATLSMPSARAEVAQQPALLVTEIMQHPGHTYDSLGEWFEIYNPGPDALDLEGWTIRDDNTDSHVIVGSLVVPAAGFVVLARNADMSRNGGVAVDYAYGDTVFLFNGVDQLELVDPDGAVRDRVAWDDGATFPDPAGASMSLRGVELDNSAGTNWCTAVTVFGTGDLGTPGAANVCEAAETQILVTEVMQNPDSVGDLDGEWIELHNAGSEDVSLAGWTVRDDDFDFHRIPANSSLMVPSGGYVVLGRNGDPLLNGGIQVDYVIGSDMVLHNTQDEIVVTDADDRLVDVVAYDDGATFPDPRGASMSLRSPELDNSDGENWCESPVTTGPVDLATPGAVNDCVAPEPPPSLVITEVMQNPAQVSDSYGEWFEVHNPTASAVDVAGWIIRDEDTNRHVVASSVVIAPGGYAVFARDADVTRNGGVAVDYEYGDDLVLFNSHDELILTDPALMESDRVAWDDGLSFPDPDGASMALVDVNTDNNAGGNWCTSENAFGAGDLGTPGRANDCESGVADEIVIITEIHQNPFAVTDTYGEWFEVSNPTSSDIDLNGWVVRDDDSDYHKIAAPGGVVVPAAGSIVIGRSLDETLNGGAGVDYSVAGSVHLLNTSDEIEIVDTTGRVVDRVAWDHAAPDWTVRNGASMALSDLHADNMDAAAWCVSGPQFGLGDLGTPGVENDCDPLPSGPLVISEVMQNPAAVPDSAGEWFEVYNAGPEDVDIDGWTIRDNDFASHVINNEDPLMVPSGGYVVLGRNAFSAQNGGAAVAYGFGADVTLSNETDELELLNESLVPIDRIVWDDGATFPDPSGASMALRDMAIDNAPAAAWCVSVTPFGLGDYGTPGMPNLCEIPPVGNPVDLAIEFNDKFGDAEVGDRLRYEVIGHNESSQHATEGLWDVVLSLPVGVVFNKDYSHQRWDCALDELPAVRCTYNSSKDVRAGKKTGKISIEVIVAPNAPDTLVAVAALDLSGATFHDPNPGNDAVVVETSVGVGEPSGSYDPLPEGVDSDLSAILECVVDHADGTLTARFGYENRESYDFSIPEGSANRLNGPVLSTSGPWTEFGHPGVVSGRPGRTPFGEGVFTVTFPVADQIVWMLHGRTATASNGSPRCDLADGAATTKIPGLGPDSSLERDVVSERP